MPAQNADPSPVQADPAPQTATDNPNSAPTPDPNESAVPAAGDLLSQLRARLEGLDSLRCTLHETAVLAGMKFSAEGSYLQSSGNRLRLEFHISPASTVKAADAESFTLNAEPPAPAKPDANSGYLLQVSDGSVLSSYWKNGKDQRVTRRNIASILKAAGETTVYDPTRALQDLGLGGLNALFARLQTSMEFSKVKREKVGSAEFLVVTGRWNQKIRKEVFQLKDDAEVIPLDFIPEYVRLYIDESTSLPRRIQYLKRFTDPSQKLVRPIVTLDIRKIVLNDAVQDSEFVFTSPENVPEDDITEQTIQSILNAGKPAAPSASDPATDAPAGSTSVPATPETPGSADESTSAKP